MSARAGRPRRAGAAREGLSSQATGNGREKSQSEAGAGAPK